MILARPREQRARSAVSLFVERIGRRSFVYILTGAANLLVGLASVAVMTRLLSKSDFGRLTLLSVTSSVITIVVNAGSLQGTFAWVFGGAIDDEGGDLDDHGPRAADRGRALMTGVATTVAAGLAVTAVITLLRNDLAVLITGDRSFGGLIALTAASAAASAVWRLASNILRYENRPVAYGVAVLSMGLLSLGGSVAIVASGGGVEGAVVGSALGTGVSVVLALSLAGASLAPRASFADAVQIYRRGVIMVPVVLAFATIHLGDAYLVSAFVSKASVGVFRVGARIGAFANYWVTALNMTWGPIQRDPLHAAAERQRGRNELATLYATYFALSTAWAVLTLVVLAPLLVRIAASGFSPAAHIVPVTATAAAFYGFFVLVYRTVSFPSKRPTFVVASVVAAVGFIGAGWALLPVVGYAGAPIGAIIGWSMGSAVMLWRNRGEVDGPRFDWPRILSGLALGGALVTAVRFVDPGSWRRVVLDAALWGSYPVLLVVLRIVPRRHAGAFWAVLRAQLVRLARLRSERLQFESLDSVQRSVLALIIVDRRSLAEAAEATGLGMHTVESAAVGGLMRTAGIPGQPDPRLARYLLDRMTYADRAMLGQDLWAEGADPLLADRLIRQLKRVRRRRRELRH